MGLAHRHAGVAAFVSASIALGGCGGALSTLAPAGPSAHAVAHLWWAMLIGAGLLALLVWGLLGWAWHARSEGGPPARFWTLGMGVGMPLVVLTVLVGAGLWLGEGMQARQGPNVVVVQADARQWAWSFVQPGPQGQPVQTEGQLFIPAGVPVNVEITSRDVVHSFWVPQLAGKMDAIPGHRNVLRIQADAPGRYEGLSAEFSGVGYGDMRFVVVAYPAGQMPDMAAAVTQAASPSDPPALLRTAAADGAVRAAPSNPLLTKVAP